MYQCEKCLKSYKWKDSLTRHFKHKHKFRDNLQHDLCVMDAEDSDLKTLKLSNKSIEFRHPFTMTISGPTGSGKTYLLKEMLKKNKITPAPKRIVYLYRRWQPLYSEMLDTIPGIEFIKGIPSDLSEDDFFNTEDNNMVICDDLMTSASIDPNITDLFTEGSHHRNLSVVNLTQNLFPSGKHSVTQRRNTQYMIIFKSPMSQDQIRTLGTFMFPGKLDQFLRVFQQATAKPHGHLVIDAKQATPEDERLKSNILIRSSDTLDDGALFFCTNCQYSDAHEVAFDNHICRSNTVSSPQATIPSLRRQLPTQDTSHAHVTRTLANNAEQPDPHNGGGASESSAVMDDIKGQTQTVLSHSTDRHRQDSMDKLNSCMQCGALYSTPQALFSHIKICDSDMSSDSDSSSESGWQDMLQEVYDKNDDLFQNKIQKYQGDENARQKVKDDMLPIYKQSLLKLFSKMFLYSQQMENSEHFDKILSDFTYYIREKKYSKGKALRAAIRVNNSIFDELLDDDDSSDDFSSDDNMSDSEDLDDISESLDTGDDAHTQGIILHHYTNTKLGSL